MKGTTIMKLGTVILLTLAGAAAGAAAGILYAPARGEVTRRRLVRNGTAAVEDAGASMDSAIDELTDAAETIRNRTEKVYRNGRRLFSNR